MRCPKCGFNSFDHNLLCPKCRKDLTATRRLLNLTMPIPGATDFFTLAGQRVAVAQPFLGAQGYDDGAQSMDTGQFITPDATLMPGQFDEIIPLAELDDVDEITPIDDIMPIDEISPIEDISPLEEIIPAAASDEFDDIAPLDEPDMFDDVEPVMDRGAQAATFSGHPAPGGDEEIEIEIDDVEVVEAAAEPAQAAPAPHQTAMNQIKNTLTQTGDLGGQEALEVPGDYALEEIEEAVVEEAPPAPGPLSRAEATQVPPAPLKSSSSGAFRRPGDILGLDEENGHNPLGAFGFDEPESSTFSAVQAPAAPNDDQDDFALSLNGDEVPGMEDAIDAELVEDTQSAPAPQTPPVDFPEARPAVPGEPLSTLPADATLANPVPPEGDSLAGENLSDLVDDLDLDDLNDDLLK